MNRTLTSLLLLAIAAPILVAGTQATSTWRQSTTPEEESTCANPLVHEGIPVPPLLLVATEVHTIRNGDRHWFVSLRGQPGPTGVEGYDGDVDLYVWSTDCFQIVCHGVSNGLGDDVCPYAADQRVEIRYVEALLDKVPGQEAIHHITYSVGLP